MCARSSAVCAPDSADERSFVVQSVMTSATDVIQAQVDAYNARDGEAFANCYDEDATVIGPDGTVMMTGRDANASVYGQFFAQSPDLHVEIRTRIGAGDWVVDEEDTRDINFEGDALSHARPDRLPRHRRAHRPRPGARVAPSPPCRNRPHMPRSGHGVVSMRVRLGFPNRATKGHA
jgi:hypothetical protein